MIRKRGHHRPIYSEPPAEADGAASSRPFAGSVGKETPTMPGDDEYDVDMEHMEALEQLQKRTAQGAGGTLGRTERGRRARLRAWGNKGAMLVSRGRI